MKKRFVLFCIIFAVSCAGIGLLSVFLNRKGEQAEYTLETLEGDPAVVADMEIHQSIRHGQSHNRWDNVIYPGETIRTKIHHKYDRDPELFMPEGPESLEIHSGVHPAGLSYVCTPVQPGHIQPEFYREMIESVAAEAPSLGDYQKKVHASDFFEYCPLTFFIELKDHALYSEDIELLGEEERSEEEKEFAAFYREFSSFIKIPVEEEDRILVTLERNSDGSWKQINLSADNVENDIRAASVFSETRCYLQVEDTVYSFELNPHRIPVFESMKIIYQEKDHTEKIQRICISEDKNSVMIIVLKGEDVYQIIYDDTMETVRQELPLIKGSDKNVQVLQDGNSFMIMNEKNEFAVTQKEDSGEYMVKILNQYYPEEDSIGREVMFFKTDKEKVTVVCADSCDIYLSVYEKEKILYRGIIRSSFTDTCTLTEDYYITDGAPITLIQ